MKSKSQKELRSELRKICKRILKKNKKLLEVMITGISLNSDGKRRVNGFSWRREDLIKPSCKTDSPPGVKD